MFKMGDYAKFGFRRVLLLFGIGGIAEVIWEVSCGDIGGELRYSEFGILWIAQ